MGISIRAFAREDGCSEGLVRKALKSGRLSALPDGTINPAQVGTGWRKANRRKAAISSRPADGVDQVLPAPPDLEAIADRVVTVEGRAPYSLVEAERIKENYLAMLRQLQYDRESAELVPIEVIAQEVEREYAIVRERLLTIPGKVSAVLAGCDRLTIEQVFAAEINEALAELSEQATLEAGTR